MAEHRAEPTDMGTGRQTGPLTTGSGGAALVQTEGAVAEPDGIVLELGGCLSFGGFECSRGCPPHSTPPSPAGVHICALRAPRWSLGRK